MNPLILNKLAFQALRINIYMYIFSPHKIKFNEQKKLLFESGPSFFCPLYRIGRTPTSNNGNQNSHKMNRRKHEFEQHNPGLLRKFLRSSNKTTRKIAFFLVVVFLSGLIWLVGWIIELIVVNLWNLAAWVINLL